MVDKAEIKAESLLNLDDLLQCPVCYEIPSGQIFQCNEGHHVCGRCKMRLDVCPVCRALFFGTRNYAMEELIANFRKLRAFKTCTKVQNGSGSSESRAPAKVTTPEECENDNNEDEEDTNANVVIEPPQRAPQSCKGLFRCLCCKNGNVERLPAARLLNHLRYFHAPDLLEGRSENGEYLQAWQFTTTPGKIVTAVRIADMGVFFLTIEFNDDSVYAWLMMAASPWVAHTFNYTITICGNDREAIFSDCVWSVRSCEGSLKKRGHCLFVKEMDAQALMAPAIISGKLSVRRAPSDQLTTQTQPRAVLRIANRGNNSTSTVTPSSLIQDLQDDVERLYSAFANIGRETAAMRNVDNRQALLHEEAESDARTSESAEEEAQPLVQQETVRHMSRNARRRMRLRARAMLASALSNPNSVSASNPAPPMPNRLNSGTSVQLPSTIRVPQTTHTTNGIVDRNLQRSSVPAATTVSRLPNVPAPIPAPIQTSRQNGCVYARPLAQLYSEPSSAPASIGTPLVPSPSASGPSQSLGSNGSRNKKKRRQRR